jgi:hypothetical protein
MGEYIKFWLAKEIAEWIVIVPFLLVIGIGCLIFVYFTKDE